MKETKVLKIEKQIGRLVALQLETQKLPPLADVEKAKFDQALAIDQLYYSSRLEGSALTKKMIDKAINAKKFSVA
ncbi:MAG TPA: hypothetical protein VMU70_02295 [Candidatus Tyrphobacter sp.]|nr:hypothetical protein [Candidatus Tyrphobacter sp.]